MTGVAGIIASLFLLMLLAYRNHCVLMIAPACALLAVAVDGELPVLASYTQIFLVSLGSFIERYFPLFLLGSIFGKMMEETGSAATIVNSILRCVGPQRAVLALVLTCSLLTYGGVSLFVVVFTVYPMAVGLFRQANLPQRLIPGAIALGSFTYTMTAMPGSVQIQNLIPMPFFKTNSFAAPVMGLAASAMMFTLGMVWLSYRVRQAQARGEGFGEKMQNAIKAKNEIEDQAVLPSLAIALMPLFCMVIFNFIFSQYVVPDWKADYLAQPKFGSTELKKVQGVWATILAMTGAIFCLFILHFRQGNRIKNMITHGANSSLMPVFNAASEFGYGSTIAALAGFGTIRDWMTGIAPSRPLISEAISVNVLAGITGSASGGLSIALEALGKTYFEKGLAAGIDPGVMHRVASLSCGGLDTLPHNGAVITLLLICGQTHRESYWDIAMVSVMIPILTTATMIILQ
jgi:H+/gluconate symporter-like permease